MEIQEHINSAYGRLMTATEEAHGIGERLIEEEAKLNRDKAKALADGIIDGKNEAAREGQAFALFINQYAEVDSLAKVNRLAKLRLDLARLEVERVRALLRLLEFVQGETE